MSAEVVGWSSMPDVVVIFCSPPVGGSVECPGVGSVTVGVPSSRAGGANLMSLLCNFTGTQSFSSGVTQKQLRLPAESTFLGPGQSGFNPFWRLRIMNSWTIRLHLISLAVDSLAWFNHMRALLSVRSLKRVSSRECLYLFTTHIMAKHSSSFICVHLRWACVNWLLSRATIRCSPPSSWYRTAATDCSVNTHR